MTLLQADPGMGIVSALFFLTIRIVAIFVCRDKAKELNRNPTSWATFGFFFPIVAIILGALLKTRNKMATRRLMVNA